MTKNEVIERLAQKGLMKVQRKGHVIEYTEGDTIFYNGTFHNKRNVYGVYYNDKYKKYAFFVTGEERGGIVDYYSKHDTEDEAFTALLDYIDLLSRTQSK